MYSENEKRYNWSNKQECAEYAKQHVALMEEKYIKEIKESVSSIKIYTGIEEVPPEALGYKMQINVTAEDSVSAVMKYTDEGKACVLNFASYTNPGGKFLEGSKAQEESLCAESTLYNVLNRCKEFYAFNKSVGSNKCLYRNHALYAPNIVFERDDKVVKCDVLTCAAPNYTAARKYKNVGQVENTRYLRRRIEFVLDVAESQLVDTLILGAYGCGVFGQNPNEVANHFREFLLLHRYGFKRVIFAIPNSSNNNNFDTFKRVFGNCL